MANSRVPGPLGLFQFSLRGPYDIPGVLGIGENVCYRDSPGVLGLNDWAAFSAEPRLPAPAAASACACNRDITLGELCAIYAAQKRAKCEEYLPDLNATFDSYSISSCLRKAHFLAQVGHESGELTYSAEVLPKGKKEADVYDGYKGRGLMQITYKKNYEAYGKAVDHDFTGTNRTDLEQSKWATDSAGNYWTTHNNDDLNNYADKNDLLAITAHVNGAFNGFSDRLSLLKAGFKALKVRECRNATVDAADYLPFARSDVHESYVYSFAWGAWNDPASKKKGVNPQSAIDRQAAYARYLEFRADQLRLPLARQPNHKRYGFTVKQMDDLANAGVK